MGGCATKPKVEETTAPAPETEKEVVVNEENATAAAEEVSREIVVDGVEKVEEVESGIRSRSLSNLLKEVVDEKEKAKTDDEQLGSTQEPLSQPSELAKQEQQSTPQKQVLEVVEFATETQKIVDQNEALHLKDTAKIVDVSPEVPKSENLKPSELKTVDTVVEAPKPETSKPSELSKPVVVAPEAPKPESSKTSEPAKTVEAVVEVTKSDTSKPAAPSKPVVAATSEAPKAADPALTLPETISVAPAKVEAVAPIKPEVREVPKEKSPEVKKLEVKEEKPIASGSAKA